MNARAINTAATADRLAALIAESGVPVPASRDLRRQLGVSRRDYARAAHLLECRQDRTRPPGVTR